MEQYDRDHCGLATLQRIIQLPNGNHRIFVICNTQIWRPVFRNRQMFHRLWREIWAHQNLYVHVYVHMYV